MRKKEQQEKAKDSRNYKQINDLEAKIILEKAKKEYLEKCQGFESFFDFLQKEYGFNPTYWVRTARKIGYDIIKKGNKFYLKIEMNNDTSRD